jgi:hypothetical protein
MPYILFLFGCALLGAWWGGACAEAGFGMAGGLFSLFVSGAICARVWRGRGTR